MAMRAPLLLLAAALVSPAAKTQDRIFELAPGLVPDVGPATLHAVGDVDGDGTADFSVGGLSFGLALAVVSGDDGIPILTFSSGSELPLLVVDLDGDGLMEFVSSTSFYRAADLLVRDGGAQGRVLYRLAAPVGSSTFGALVTAVADLDGDGVREIAVSAPLEAVEIGGTFVSGIGVVWVFSGADGSALHRLCPPRVVLDFGTAVAGLPDVSGDGVPDIAVGTRGDAFLYSGRDGSVLHELGTTHVSGRYGCAIADAGDLDGDGWHDVIVGASQAFTTQPGYAIAFSGTSGREIYRLTGEPADFFGAAVAGIDDLDGDGVSDLLIGAPQRLDEWHQSGPGHLHAFSGVDGAPLFTVAGEVDGEGFGASVVSVGDVNGDGIPDLAVSRGHVAQEPFSPPVVRVLSGAPLVLTGAPHLLTAAQGGTHALAIDATAAHAGAPYVVLGTLSGTAPGTTLRGVPVPLNPDAWTLLTVAGAGSALLPGSVGVLDAQGCAQAALVLPPLPGLQGLRFDHAALVVGPGSIDVVSRPVPLTLMP